MTQSQDAFSGLESSALVRPYQLYSGTWPPHSAEGGKTLTDLAFLRDPKSDKVTDRLEIAAFLFADSSQVAKGVRSTRMNVQAATSRMPMKEFAKLGYETDYVGNPQCVELNTVADRVWVRVRLYRGDLVWQPERGVDWAEAGAETLRKDPESMKLLQRLLPDLRKRAQKAAAESETG